MNIITILFVVILVVLILIESHLLLTILPEVSRLRSIFRPDDTLSNLDEQRGAINIREGASAPSFSVTSLIDNREITNKDLLGTRNVMLFVRLTDIQSLGNGVILTIISGMWGKSDDRVFVVCHGDRRGLMSFCNGNKIGEDSLSQLSFIADENGELMSLFDVIDTPSAIVFDQYAKVLRVGHLDAIKNPLYDSSATADSTGVMIYDPY